MFISITNKSSELLYEQIENRIIEKIIKGELEPGYMLPSIRVLAKELGISVITIKKAYEDLENAGYIITRSGKGSFVNELEPSKLRAGSENRIRAAFWKIINECREMGYSNDEIVEMFNKSMSDDIK